MKMIKPDLGEIDIEFNVSIPNPDIDEKVNQSLVYLIGYDETNEKFRLVSVDSDGRVYTSSGSIKTLEAYTTRTSIALVAGLIIDENSDREKILVQNMGSETLYIGFDNTVTILTGFPLPPNSVWEDNTYLGSVYGICATTGVDVAIIEMV